MRKVVVVLLSLAAHAASALPNLQVIEAKHFASGCLNVEQAYHGSGTVKNGGDVAAQNFKVLIIMYGEDSFFKRERVTDDDLLAMYYEKSDDPRIRDSMFLKEVASLVPGETRTFEVDRTLPADAPCQRYGLRVIADVDNAVAESSEEDNAKNGIPYFPCINTDGSADANDHFNPDSNRDGDCFSNTLSHDYGDRDGDQHRRTDGNSNALSHSNSIGNRDQHGSSDSYTDRDGDSVTYRNVYVNSDCKRNSDQHWSTHSHADGNCYSISDKHCFSYRQS
ncbi:MAG: hypothetical protein UY68_C0012G0025 [Parcubacteria group bacterium GW2011_GWF2_52_12]|nr:MAG: hypothetical protein UY68_C0012G0025 [Parcubacteria group bacterium GW2011_GWF2_52_12]